MSYRKSIVSRLLAVCSMAALLCAATVESHAAVLVIDTFSDFFALSPNSSSTIITDNAVGGSRRVVSGLGVSSQTAYEFLTIDAKLTEAITFHGWSNDRTASIIYGYSEPLNLNFLNYSDQGDLNNIFVRGYARVDDTQNSAVISLSLFDGSNQHTINQTAFYYADLKARLIEWDVNAFKANGVDIENIQQITFTVSGIKMDGDVYFGILDAGAIPEPGTLALLGLASVMVYALRRKHSAVDLRA